MSGIDEFHKCGICNKPVNPMHGMHGPTGDHWDCFEKRNQEKHQKIMVERVRLLTVIANKYAPDRESGISDGQLLAICAEFTSALFNQVKYD